MMKRYILAKHFYYDNATVQTDNLEQKDLLDLKDGMCEAVIDTNNQTYFDAENNEWKKIEEV